MNPPSLKILGFLVLLFLIYVNLARFLNFALNIAGFEHDSGWYFGVAENLGLKGKYASFTNTSAEEKAGIVMTIHNRLAIVDKDGFEYFPSGVTIGPAFIFPVALVLKLFGVGFWQFRLFPIVTYCLLLGVILWLVYKQTGILGTLFGIILLNLFPNLVISLAFESFAEPTGFLYLLLGVIFLSFSLKKRSCELLFVFLAGVFISCSVLTKTVYLLNYPALLFLYFLVLKRSARGMTKGVAFTLSFFAPIVLFELYRFLTLWKVAGPSAYLANLSSMVMIFIYAGSGLEQLDLRERFKFLSLKFSVFEEIGIKNVFGISGLLLVIGFLIRERLKEKDHLFLFLAAIELINLVWFFGFSSTGWARHFWPGLILTILFLAIFLGKFSTSFGKSGSKNALIFCLIITFLIGLDYLGAINPAFIYKTDLGGEILAGWRNKFFTKKPQGLPLPIFPLKEQKEMAEFIKNNIPKKAKIFYVGGFLVAEIPPLVDRIFYSVERAKKTDLEPKFVIFGPYQVSSDWRIIPLEEYARQLTKYCGQEVFSNNYYKICVLYIK